MRIQSGQIMVLVLLVVVVVLAVGLSVASRNITNLKTSTQTEQSQRAFSAAEGGVEDVLARLNLVAQAINSGNVGSSGCSAVDAGNKTATCPVLVGTGNLTANVTVKAAAAFEQTITEGRVGQINLDGAYVGGVRTINIEWARKNTPESSGTIASLELNFVCASLTCFGDSVAAAGQTYSQHRLAYNVNASSNDQSGFTSCPSTNSANYNCIVTITLSQDDSIKLLRIRPFWNNATVKVSTPNPGFPIQEYNLTSSVTTDLGVTRKVQVARTSLPQLPAVFDYVLYAEDANTGIVK